jgi:hypothetical protein
MFDAMNRRRRQLLRTTAQGIAATQFGLFDAACTQSAQTNQKGAIAAAPPSSFDTIKQVDAGVLNIGYAEAGRAGGPVAILPHGWPYDIHAFVDVAPLVATNGYPSQGDSCEPAAVYYGLHQRPTRRSGVEVDPVLVHLRRARQEHSRHFARLHGKSRRLERQWRFQEPHTW